MNLYLDIDGVLLCKDGTLADHAVEFLDYIVNNHEVYWLTTHCNGDATVAVDYLRDKLPNETIELIGKIKPTKMTLMKTDQIDFSKKFLWIDDYVMEAERKLLEEKGYPNGVFKVDLKANPSQLLEIMAYVRQNIAI